MKRHNRHINEGAKQQSNYQERNISEEDVRKKAYELAEGRGFEPGHEIEDWLEAEKAVRENF